MKRLSIVLSAGLYLIWASSVFGGPPPLTPGEVVRIADAFAKKQGLCLSCYKRPVLRYHERKSGNYWTAYYAPLREDSETIPADSDFSVRIDEATRIASNDPLR